MKQAARISLSITLVCVFLLSGIFGLSMFSTAASAPLSSAATTQTWTSFTYNYNNSRYNANSLVTASNVKTLKLDWHVDTGQVNTGQPIVSNGAVYFGDWGGYAYSVNLTNGKTIWKDDMSIMIQAKLGHPYKAQISSTFLAQGGVIYGGMSPYGPVGITFALNQKTGALIWADNLSASPFSSSTPSVWGSPIYYNGLIYIGTAAYNESNSKQHGFVFALNANTGALAWKFEAAKAGFIGGAGVWSSIVVDPALNAVYFGTANSYAPAKQTPYSEGIISLNAMTGALNWVFLAHNPSQGDLDIGETPNLFTVNIGGTVYQAVSAGSKDGYEYVVNRMNGALLEKIEVSTGSGHSGVIGLAGFVYNSANNPEVYIPGENAAGHTSEIRAYLPATNKFAWTHVDPESVVGSVTVIPGAILYPDNGGYITALNSATGAQLYRAHFTGEARGGITVVGNMVLFTTSDGCYALILG